MGELIFKEPVSAPMGDGYGDRRGGKHYGIDYQTPIGTMVKTSERGQVVRASFNERKTNNGGSYGFVVIIDHTPYAKKSERHLYTLYAHLHEINVHAGQEVVLGQPIGASGNTGTKEFYANKLGGRHLHFEIIDNPTYIAWNTEGELGILGHVGSKDPVDYFNITKEVKGTTDEHWLVPGTDDSRASNEVSDEEADKILDRIEIAGLKLGDDGRWSLGVMLDGELLGSLDNGKKELEVKVRI